MGQTCADKHRQWTLQGSPKSKPLSGIIIKSYWKPPERLDFSSVMITKWHMFVVNTLGVTYFVTSSVADFEAMIRVKSMHMIKSWLKTKKQKIWKSDNFVHMKLQQIVYKWTSQLMRADSRGSADIYCTWGILLLCWSDTVNDITK